STLLYPSLHLPHITTPSFFSTDPATTELYTLSLHDALPISGRGAGSDGGATAGCIVGETHIGGNSRPDPEAAVDHRDAAHLCSGNNGQHQGQRQHAADFHRSQATVNAMPSRSPIAALKRTSSRGLTRASTPEPREKARSSASPNMGASAGWM